jgi:regulator of sigma E protease
VITAIVSFIVVIGILILIHEWGHFIVARLSGVGVERFSIGFGPVLWRYRGKETEYCLSAIPMGGYVKMVGDDESPLEGGKTDVVDPARAFNLKPIWKRFLIVFAGPGMNFVLAAAILAALPMVFGRPMVPAVIGRVVEGGPAAQAGVKAGDRIVAVDGQPVEYWEQVQARVQESRGGALRLTVRGTEGERTVAVTPARVASRDLLGDEREVWDLGVRTTASDVARIGEVVAGRPAAKAGLKPGDVVVSVAERPVRSWEDLAEVISKRPGQPTELVVKRGEETLTVTVTPEAEKGVGRIGISHLPAPPPGVVFVRSWNPLTALRDGVMDTIFWTRITVKAMYKLVTAQLPASNLGGPIQIAVAAGQQARQGLASLAFFTAVISINLAVLNLLPVPMLDGGHLLFFVCEAILGRPISVRKRELAQQVGFVLLMLLMVYAVYNDLTRLDVLRFFR